MSKSTAAAVQTVSIGAEPSSSHTVGHPREQMEVQETVVPDVEVVYPTGIKLAMAMLSMAVVGLLVGLDLTIVAAAVPSLTDHFHSLADIGWYTSIYGVMMAAFALTFGRLYTLFSVKRVFLISICIFEIGCIICTAAPTSHAFIFGRALSGLGAAGISNGAFSILTQCFPVHKRPVWIAVLVAAQSIGLVSAPAVGGGLIDWLSWRACFAVNVPPGLAAIVMIAYAFQEITPNPDTNLPLREKVKRIDIVGTCLLVPAVACLMLALQFGGARYGWPDARVVALFVVCAVLLAAFGALQYRLEDKATIPPRILKNRTVLAGAWFSVCTSGVLGITEYYMSIYFQGVKGYSAAKSGVFILPMLLGASVAAISAGPGIAKLGYYNPFMIATSILAPIASGVLTTIKLDDGHAKALGCLAMLGFAVGLGVTVPGNAVSATLPTKDISLGIAVISLGGGIGSSLFVAASAALFQRRLTQEMAKFAPGTNVTQLEMFGLSDIRTMVGGDRLVNVLLGYDEAVTQTLYLPVALGVASLVGTVFTEWRSIKKKQA